MSPAWEVARVRIGRTDGEPAYEGVVAIAREGGREGVGEAAVIPGRPGAGEAAEAAAREIAELDLAARHAGVRLADLLAGEGGTPRDSVECTALVTEPRPADVAREVEALAAAGFAAFKLKSVDGGGELDVARVGAARWAAGAGARLRIDFNGRLGMARALAVLPTLERLSLELIEQPLAAGEPVAAWERLRAVGPAPLFADESLADPAAACALARAGIGMAIKLTTAGGPRGALRLAGAAPWATVGSGMESSIGLAAALHVACALPAAPLACGLATRGRLEGDLASGLEVGPWARLPAGPGLGVELDPAALARYRVDR